MGVHFWVGMSSRGVALCDCCNEFYELGARGKVVGRVESLNRSVRRRMEKGLVR